jgi:hypothetical protein
MFVYGLKFCIKFLNYRVKGVIWLTKNALLNNIGKLLRLTPLKKKKGMRISILKILISF